MTINCNDKIKLTRVEVNIYDVGHEKWVKSVIGTYKVNYLMKFWNNVNEFLALAMSALLSFAKQIS